MNCPYCGEDYWIYGPRWGVEVCGDCGTEKPKPEDDE